MDKYSTSVQFNMDESNWQTEMYQLFKRDFIDTGLVFQHSQDAGFYDTYVREDFTEPVMTYDIISDFIPQLFLYQKCLFQILFQHLESAAKVWIYQA